MSDTPLDPDIERSVVDEPRERPALRVVLIGLAIGLIGPFALGLLTLGFRLAAGFDYSFTIRTSISEAISWLVTAALLIYVVRVERRPLGSIGWRGVRWTYIATSPLWWLLGFAVQALFIVVLHDHLDTSRAQDIRALPLVLRIVIVITAAVTEEVAFRGYVMERVHELTGRMWVAATVSTLLFVAAHIPFYGPIEAFVRLPMTLVLIVRYVRTRSLVPVVAVHFIADAPLMFVS